MAYLPRFVGLSFVEFVRPKVTSEANYEPMVLAIEWENEAEPVPVCKTPKT
jgi:hypothetical protein